MITKPGVQDARVSCPVCGKGFQFNSYLARHMKTHTGERSFTCPLCQLTFKRNDHLKRHFKKAHMGQGTSSGPDQRQSSGPGGYLEIQPLAAGQRLPDR